MDNIQNWGRYSCTNIPSSQTCISYCKFTIFKKCLKIKEGGFIPLLSLPHKANIEAKVPFLQDQVQRRDRIMQLPLSLKVTRRQRTGADKWLTWLDSDVCCTLQLCAQASGKNCRAARQPLCPQLGLYKSVGTFCTLKHIHNEMKHFITTFLSCTVFGLLYLCFI
jgi:hypothetical protein